MTGFQYRIQTILFSVLSVALTFLCNPVFASSQTQRLDDDSNSRIVVENAIVKGNQTTILFWTWPDLGTPNSGKNCPLNFYSVTLKPGLPSAEPTVLAKGVCGSGLSRAGLLENGDAKIIARDRLEQWRAGEKLSSERFTAIEASGNLRVTSDDSGSQFYDFSPAGDVVVAMFASGGIAPGVSLLMTALNPDNEKRWQLRPGDVGDTFGIERVWAGRDGGALLYMVRHITDSMVPVLEPQLRIVSPDGTESSFPLIETEAPFDMASIQPGSQEDLQKFFEHQKNAKPESIESLAARPRDGGGFDVLIQRKGGGEGRSGHFLYQFASDGSLHSEVDLGDQLELSGLENLTDFYVSNGQLLVLSKVLATQHGVQSGRKKWMQSAVSQLDLSSGAPVSRLIPLDDRYLEAAMNAGDAGQQYLEGQPGGEPVLLTSVGGVPLAVEVGYLKGRNTLRLSEVTQDLVVFTEIFDERQAKIAKENARQQKKAAREEQKQEMNADMAAAVGMTPEEYSALSNKERKEAMVRDGDINAMMAAAMQQADAAKQAMAASGASPEQMAQMEAAMAQVQQMTQGTGSAMPAQNDTPTEKGTAEPVLTVDALLRGHVQFRNLDGRHTTLIVFNRQTGEELLKKEYEDGFIDEYVDFGRYKLPLEQIGLLIRNISGEILQDLTPTVDS